jgi:acetoin utilization deacetylase AcuC-like enzyme
VADESDFLRPQPASDDDILLAHTPGYVHKLKTGTLSPREEEELEMAGLSSRSARATDASKSGRDHWGRQQARPSLARGSARPAAI